MESAVLLRSARRRARLTQTQLAARAGVTQSVVSAYEAGRRQPSLATLSSLIAATGYELDLQLRSVPRRLNVLTGSIGTRVRQNRRRLLDRAAAHGIRNLVVFGSVARGEEGPGSDLDLAAELPAGMGLVGLGRAREDFEAIVGCPVDLVPFEDLKTGIRERVEAEMVAL
jgi:uncharacterized protein